MFEYYSVENNTVSLFHRPQKAKKPFLSSQSACRTRFVSPKWSVFSFDLTWLPWGFWWSFWRNFWGNFWRIVLTNFLTNYITIFWQIFDCKSRWLKIPLWTILWARRAAWGKDSSQDLKRLKQSIFSSQISSAQPIGRVHRFGSLIHSSLWEMS